MNVPQAPNILYLHSHDTGQFIAPYGHDVPTPALSKLAADGVLYRNAWCVSPTCSPSRAGLLTGQYPHECGQFGLGNRGFPLAHPERHLVHTLRKAGYFSALLGVQHLVPDERDLGYDFVRDALVGHTMDHRNEPIESPAVAESACAWLREHGNMDRPWFLDAGMVQTHALSWGSMTEAQRPTPDEIEHSFPPALIPPGAYAKEHWAHHRKSAAILDAGIGRILETLDNMGLTERTLVVYTTDHGLGVPRGKCTLNDAGLSVGMMLRGPGFDGGKVIDQHVSHLDLAPTFCALAGIDPEPWYQGRSLLDPTTERLHFSEINHHGHHQPERSVRDERWRLVRRWWSEDRPYLYNADPTPARRAWAELDPAPVAFETSNLPELHDALYDCAIDPYQTCNLVDDPRVAEVHDRLSNALDSWMHDTGDILPAAHAFNPDTHSCLGST